jgi:hypothetical protein
MQSGRIRFQNSGGLSNPAEDEPDCTPDSTLEPAYDTLEEKEEAYGEPIPEEIPETKNGNGDTCE